MATAVGTQRVEHVMGMPVVVDVRDGVGERHGRRAVRVAPPGRRAVQHLREDSDICRLNRGELALDDAHPDVREVLAGARSCAATGGLLRRARRAPGSVDPSGLVKGWSWSGEPRSSSAPARQLRDQRRRRHRRSRRRAAGPPLAGRHRAPEAAGRRRGGGRAERRGRRDLGRHTRAASTSSIRTRAARRRAALGDGRRPRPRHRRRVRDRRLRDGARGPHWTARLRGYEAMTILADGRVLSTPGFPSVDVELARA